MSRATEILKEDFEAQLEELWEKMYPVLDALRNAEEGTHEYELLNLKKEALKTEYRYLEKLIRIQYHYNSLREHAEQMVRRLKGEW